jgi:hypothetical protein
MYMDSMDNFRERIEALEQQMRAMGVHTRTVERRLRWWRGFACGVVLLGLMSRSLQSGTAADQHPGGMADRMATLEQKLSAMKFDDAANEVVITGANLRIVNGLGTTDTTNGLGNLIVGYDKSRQELPDCQPVGSLANPFCQDRRTGSHNVVVGEFNNFSKFGGIVAGSVNEISGEFASVSGGVGSTASGEFASVSGGRGNRASGESASVSGGQANAAFGNGSSVSGGFSNTAGGGSTWVGGGIDNQASGNTASISGGDANIASGPVASVSGGSSTRPAAADPRSAGEKGT